MWRRAAAEVKPSDIALALAIGATGAVEVAMTTARPAVPVTAAALGVSVAATLLRRRRPHLAAVTVVACLAVAGAADSASGDDWPVAALVVAMYSVARYTSPVAAAPELVLGLLLAAVTVARSDNDSAAMFAGNLAFVAVLVVGIPWSAGAALRRRELAAGAAAAAAAGQERIRIARELHDVVGHSLGVIAVQAGAERATLPPDAPESTRETLAAIERTTRDALDEMRRLVTVLRAPGSPDGWTPPQPTLADLDRLADQVRRAGLGVVVSVDGRPVDLPPGLELTAFRVVQEALTNALRHSGGAQADVRLVYSPTELRVTVTDDGRSRGTHPTTGHGLAGMRERVALYGGTLELRDGDGRGLALVVRLPLGRTP